MVVLISQGSAILCAMYFLQYEFFEQDPSNFLVQNITQPLIQFSPNLPLQTFHKTKKLSIIRKQNINIKKMRRTQSQSSQSQQSQQYRLQKWKKSNRKYSRITPQVKDKLIFLIVRNNMSIKQAANSVKINYSSAKFIFNQYRHKNQKCQNFVTADNLVVIRKIGEKGAEKGEKGEKGELRGIQDDEGLVELYCTVGGKFESQSIKVYTVEEIYNMNGNQNANANVSGANVERSRDQTEK